MGWFGRAIPNFSFLMKMASLFTSCHMPATCMTCQQKESPHSPEFAMDGAGRQPTASNDDQCSGGNLAGFFCVLSVLTSDLGDKGYLSVHHDYLVA